MLTIGSASIVTTTKRKYIEMLILLFKTIIFTLLVPGIVAVIVPLLITAEVMTTDSLFLLSGLLMFVIGISIYCWCVWDFMFFGRGTPAPVQAPKHLVVRGLYHYTRNPMYIGVLCVILAWGLLYAESFMLLYGVCVAICFQLLVVFYEEPLLQQQFGTEYIEYKTSVNRWLLRF